MSAPRASTTLLQRLRGGRALRGLLVFAALLTSQNALACAFEATSSNTPLAWVAGTDAASDSDSPPPAVPAPAPADDACCALCTDCALSCACCALAISLRSDSHRIGPAPLPDAATSPTTPPPASGTPSTHFRPPITAA